MHLISCAVSIAILFGIKSCSCDVLVYTQATNQVCESFVITATTVKVSGVWNNKKIVSDNRRIPIFGCTLRSESAAERISSLGGGRRAG